MQDVKEKADKEAVLCVVGNKADLDEFVEVDQEAAARYSIVSLTSYTPQLAPKNIYLHHFFAKKPKNRKKAIFIIFEMHDAMHFRASAKSGEGVSQAFEHLMRRVHHEHRPQHNPWTDPRSIDIGKKGGKKKAKKRAGAKRKPCCQQR